jgi:hypothetical protein
MENKKEDFVTVTVSDFAHPDQSLVFKVRYGTFHMEQNRNIEKRYVGGVMVEMLPCPTTFTISGEIVE